MVRVKGRTELLHDLRGGIIFARGRSITIQLCLQIVFSLCVAMDDILGGSGVVRMSRHDATRAKFQNFCRTHYWASGSEPYSCLYYSTTNWILYMFLRACHLSTFHGTQCARWIHSALTGQGKPGFAKEEND